MGVRGLKTFLERENQTRPINIGDEVNKWKRAHPGQKPIIVIDFLSLTIGVPRRQEDVICGGRHKITLDEWRRILNALKSTDCSLVFFSDLKIQEGKIEEWCARRNEEFTIYTELYDLIECGTTLTEIIRQQTDQQRKALSSTFKGMAVIASSYGEFISSVRHECDLEIAQYAKEHNALAVLTNDTDFLIFDGSWRLWSTQYIHVTKSNRLNTTEYNRHGLVNIFSLSQKQLPLFATLLANDFTHVYYNQLARFYCSMGPMKFRIHNVARYVRRFRNNNLSDEDIKQIIYDVFGYVDANIEEIFRQSLASYKTDIPLVPIDDTLEKKLLNTKMYRVYMTSNSSVEGLTMCYHDMRGYKADSILPMLQIGWMKRRRGIVNRRNKNKSITFTLLAKKSIDEHFMPTTEENIYPDFEFPPLDKLYINSSAEDEAKNADIKWTIFGWIMSFSNETISLIKTIPKEYLLIATTLLSLVKAGLLSVEQADGILYTENCVYANQTENVDYPVVLASKNVRAAHAYNIAFSHVCQNFAIAGLLALVQDCLQFDGVYFQKLMDKINKMSEAERTILFNPIKEYRVYAHVG